MADDDRIAEVLSELKRLHRRLDVLSQEHQMMHTLLKRLAQRSDHESSRRPAFSSDPLTQDLAAMLGIEPVDPPSDLPLPRRPKRR